MRRVGKFLAATTILWTSFLGSSTAHAQEWFPEDRGIYGYHSSPDYRESESHPLRVLAYVVHPIGWVLREGIFRPLSYFASSTPTRRSVMGYRDPFDYRKPSCFTQGDEVPDCRSIVPFNYERKLPAQEQVAATSLSPQDVVYLPDVNFDFNRHTLTTLGEGKVRQLAKLLEERPGAKVVLEGSTDLVGSDSYNIKLGMDRAETVKAELVRLGVPAERISTVTFGKSQPVFTEEDPWARAVNRRVAVKLEEAQAAK